MTDQQPRVTVGVPVFNGEPFLSQTIDSLLDQTFSDFEIVISDNASTDRTQEICQAYASRDPRVRYYRNEVNLGAAWNHNRVFELARGQFFRWNSADDLCAPEFLARCVDALDHEPGAVMACANVTIIDEHGNPIKPGMIPAEVASSLVTQRFRRNIKTDHPCQHIYSLIRSEALRRTDLMGGYNDADRVLLAHLSLFGRCVLIPEPLMSNRDHDARFSRNFAWRSREGAAWFDPRSRKGKRFPYWREFYSIWTVIPRSDLSWRERWGCRRAALGWFRYNKYFLLDDLFCYATMWLRTGKKATQPVSSNVPPVQKANP